MMKHPIRAFTDLAVLTLLACSAEHASEPAPAAEANVQACAGKCDASACNYIGGFVERPQRPAGRRAVALTLTLETGYDLHVGPLVDTLTQADAPATFFVTDKVLNSLSDQVLTPLRRPEFLIAPYIYINYSKPVPSQAAVRSQLTRVEDTLADKLLLTPDSTQYFRFPYGGNCAHQEALHNELGRNSVGWDVTDVGIPMHKNWVQAMVERVETRRGGTVLLHGNSSRVRKNLGNLIQALRTKNYDLASLNDPEYFPGYTSSLDSRQYRVAGGNVAAGSSASLEIPNQVDGQRVFFRAAAAASQLSSLGFDLSRSSNGAALDTWEMSAGELNMSQACAEVDAGRRAQRCGIPMSQTASGVFTFPWSGGMWPLGKDIANGTWTLSADASQSETDAPNGMLWWELVVTNNEPIAGGYEDALYANWAGHEPVFDAPGLIVSAIAKTRSGGTPTLPIVVSSDLKGRHLPLQVQVAVEHLADSSLAPNTDPSGLSFTLLHADWPPITLSQGKRSSDGGGGHMSYVYEFSVDLDQQVFGQDDYSRSALGVYELSVLDDGRYADGRLVSFSVDINAQD